MIGITGHVPPLQPGGVKHFRKVFGGGGEFRNFYFGFPRYLSAEIPGYEVSSPGNWNIFLEGFKFFCEVLMKDKSSHKKIETYDGKNVFL